MANRLIGFSGLLCAGKDTACNEFRMRYGGLRYAFADKLKLEAKAMILHLTGENVDTDMKDDRVRGLLQLFGSAGRAYKESIWRDYALTRALRDTAQGYTVIITDVRYPDEAQAIVDVGGRVCRVWCEESVRLKRIQERFPDTSLERFQHASETALTDTNFPYMMFIDSTDPESLQASLSDLTRVLQMFEE